MRVEVFREGHDVPNRKAGLHRPMPRELADSLAIEIRRTREHSGQTQEALASAAGVSVQLIRRLESGTANPTLGTLHAVAEALGSDLAEIFDSLHRH